MEPTSFAPAFECAQSSGALGFRAKPASPVRAGIFVEILRKQKISSPVRGEICLLLRSFGIMAAGGVYKDAALTALKFGSRHDMRGRNHAAKKRTYRCLTDLVDIINSPNRTKRGFLPARGEFDVRRQVVGKIDRRAVGQIVFECELFSCVINLAKVVNANRPHGNFTV